MESDDMLALNDICKTIEGDDKVDLPTQDEIPQGVITWVEDYVREAETSPGISPIDETTGALGPDRSPEDML
jgi:hypothetical protein